MSRIVAISYPDESTAARAAEELGRCARQLGIDDDAVATVVCERDGSCSLTTSRRPGGAADWNAFWGSVLAAAMGDDFDLGLDPRFRAELERQLRPGTSALLVTLAPPILGPTLEALSPFGGATAIHPDPARRVNSGPF